MKGRIKTKKAKRKQNFVSDDLINMMSGMGTNRDKGTYGQFHATTKSYQELEQLYRSTALARKLVDIIPMDMTREWRTFEDSEMKEDQIKEFTKAEKFLDVKVKVYEAMTMARVYGGSLLIPILENEDDLIEPLNIEDIKLGELKGFQVVDASYAPYGGETIETDPTTTTYMTPQFYRLTGMRGGSLIHNSRVIRFDGKKLPRREYQNNRYWHQSVLDALYNDIKSALTVSNSISALMHELNLDIINVKGLASAMVSGQEQAIKNRFDMYGFLKSMFNMAVLDEDETFSSRAAPAAGISDLVDKFYGLLSAAADIPATRFLGNSPGGLNATGDSDMRNYYDSIRAQQETTLAPKMDTIDKMISMSIWGEVQEGLDQYKWNPLWQESDQERATRELNNAQRDAIYLQNAVITEAQVAEQLMNTKTYSTITPEYVKELEDLIEEQNDATEEALNNALNNTIQPEGPDQAEPNSQDEEE